MQALQREKGLSKVFRKLLWGECTEWAIRCKGLRRWRGCKAIIKDYSFSMRGERNHSHGGVKDCSGFRGMQQA